MHELHNTTRSVITLPTANGRATINPNQTKRFEPGVLSAGFLKAVQGAKSALKLSNHSDEAVKLAADALKNIKRKGFAIVHGAGDISVEEALRREKAARVPRPVNVRDEFTKTQVKSQTGLGPAPGEDEVEQPTDEELEGGQQTELEGTDGGDAQDGAGAADGKTTRVKLEEVHPAVALLKQVDDETISMKELRTAAKAILADAMPAGNAGKDAIVEALRTALKKKA
jgi:hypothetical protein